MTRYITGFRNSVSSKGLNSNNLLDKGIKLVLENLVISDNIKLHKMHQMA